MDQRILLKGGTSVANVLSLSFLFGDIVCKDGGESCQEFFFFFFILSHTLVGILKIFNHSAWWNEDICIIKSLS